MVLSKLLREKQEHDETGFTNLTSNKQKWERDREFLFSSRPSETRANVDDRWDDVQA